MMGSTEDPKDGAAVAGTVFSAVVVYAVSYACVLVSCFCSWIYMGMNVRVEGTMGGDVGGRMRWRWRHMEKADGILWKRRVYEQTRRACG